MAELDPADQYTSGLGTKRKPKAKAKAKSKPRAPKLDPASPTADPLNAEVAKGSKKITADAAGQSKAEVAKWLAAGGDPAKFKGLTPTDISAMVQMSKDKHPFPKEEPIGDVGETFDPKTGAALSVGGQETKAGAAEKAKSKDPHKPVPGANAGPNAAESLMNAFVQQYQNAMAQVNPYISGQVGSADVAKATTDAAAGGLPTGPAPASEAGGLAMIANDASAYQKANAAGAAGVAQALTDTGKADALALKVDPYMGILQALQSEATYKTEQGSPPKSITSSKLPPGIEAAFQATIGAGPAGTQAVGAPLTLPNSTTPAPISGAASNPSTNTPSNPYGA